MAKETKSTKPVQKARKPMDPPATYGGYMQRAGGVPPKAPEVRPAG